MPLRHAPLLNRLSQIELPILPFLAPRVFTPWPKGSQVYGTHGPIQATASQVATETASKDAFRDMHTKDTRSAPACGSPEALSWKIADISPGPEHPDEISHQTSSVTSDSSLTPANAKDGLSNKRKESLLIRRAADRAIPEVRIKLLKVPLLRGSPSRNSTESWAAAFAKLSWEFDPRLNARKMPDALRTLLDKQIKRGRLSVRRFVGTGTFASILEKWPDFSLEAREAVWPYLMLRALKKRPASALKFLVASASRPYPPSYAISDSLQQIVCYYLYKVQKSDPQDVQTIFQVVLRLLDHIERGYFDLTQKTIYWLLINLEIDDACKFYFTLKQIGHLLHENTLLHFAETFARAGRTQLAIDVLRKIYSDGTDFTQPKLESVCATLLQRKHRSSFESILSDSEVFALMLNLGLQPNIQIYTILVKNAIDDGDSETAWQIHDTMLENNVKPNEYTYSILLNDAKLRMDWPSVDRIMEIARSSQICDEHLVTDLLHAMFLRHEQERILVRAGHRFFERMLTLYCEYFDSGPMKELLGTCVGTSRFQEYLPDSDGGKIHPSKYTLTVMFIALIRGFSDTRSTLSWYHHFRELLLNGHPEAVPLAESTYLYDAVIMVLGRTSKTMGSNTMRLCTNVVRDMLNSYEEAEEAAVSSQEVSASDDGDYPSARATQSEHLDRLPPQYDSVEESPLRSFIEKTLDSESHGGNSIRDSQHGTHSHSNSAAPSDTPCTHCQPSIRTWSILLKIFMDHNQPRAAEKVIRMMKARGIEPNLVTWNSLAIGYARMQDITGTVETIERFEKQGLKADEVTMTGLQWIRNRSALIRAINRKSQLLGKKPNSRKEREMVLTNDVCELIEVAERHLPLKKKQPERICPKLPESLGFGVNDLIFPSDEDQSQGVLECFREMIDDQDSHDKKYSTDRQGE